MEHSDKINSVLVELEQVLAEEHIALLALDREGIERAGERKLTLDQQLRDETRDARPRPEHLDILMRVKKAALKNQLLIVHARASVQSVLSMVAGNQFSTYGTSASRSIPAPVRLDVRG